MLKTLTLVIALAAASSAQAWWQPLKAQATNKLGKHMRKAFTLGVAAHVFVAASLTPAAAHLNKQMHNVENHNKDHAQSATDRLEQAMLLTKSYIVEAEEHGQPIPIEHQVFQFALLFGDLPIIELMSAEKGTKEIYNNFYSIHRTMYWAARYGHPHIVKYAWENGVNSNPDSFSLRRSKEAAALDGNLDIVQYLHQLGASGTIQALYAAARGGEVATFHYLLMTAYEEHNQKLPHVILEESLWRALIYDRLAIIKYLLPYLDETVWSETINEHLTTAAIYGHLEIVKYLIAAGASDIITAIENVESVIRVANQRGDDSTQEQLVLQYLQEKMHD